ncbi:hypothetical protein BKA93DRAFT_737765 [Sparassis latifolia]|uniref:DUF202 domain-containing protein n=1 Tax=Sparassis crispa TaxID=139825 RepID=A0A401GSJ8_9APHY|nr:predicted protein [Sparassis crispa]GBE85211.1 predicted protein [Sparassis crispa]
MEPSAVASPLQSTSNLPASPPNSDATHPDVRAYDGPDRPPFEVANETASPVPSTADRRRKKKKKRQGGGGADREVPRFPFNLALTLENSGSVARDHLASERTFLAYVRTSVAISSTGVALVQLFTIAEASNQKLEKYSRPLGATFIMIGLFTLALGGARYFEVQGALIRGVYPAIRISVVLVSVALGAVILIVFCIILAVRK